MVARRSPYSLIAAAVAASGLVGFDSDALAQGRRTTIEEIIVTARKTEESIQDTPISIQAFSTKDLESIGAYEADAVANYTPNVRMQKQTSSQDNFSYSIRGVSSGETALAVDPTVGLYMDGVYIARSTGAAFDIVDLERIEILRGPQGTLFGRNTIGGAINIITEKPLGEFAFKQLLAGGSDSLFRTQTTIDTPKVGDFAFKLSHMYNEQDGFLKSAYTDKRLGDNSSEAYRIAVRWTPTEDWTVDYTYDRSERENNSSLEQFAKIRDTYASPFSPVYGGPLYQQAAVFASQHRTSKIPVQVSDDDDSFSDITGHALIAEWDVSMDLTFKSITSYREWRSGVDNTNFGAIVADGATLFDLATFRPITAGTLVPLFGASRRSSQDQFTQEFQFVGSALDERLNYNVGLYYFEEQAKERNPQRLILPTAIASSALVPFLGAGTSVVINQPFFAYKTDNESYAVYGQFTYTVIDDLDVTLGLRYTEDKKETTLTQNFRDPGFGAAGRVLTITDDKTWSNFNPSLTVDYQWTEELSTYGKVATGYRAGGYNVRATTTTSFNSPVDEENIISYEVGWKSDWLDSSLRFNGAIFYMDYDDRQIASFEAGSGGASTNILNAGQSSAEGFELDLIWIPTPGLQLTAGYGYLKVDYDEFITSRVDPVTAFPIPGPLPGGNSDIADIAADNLYAPEHSGVLAVDYQFEPWSFGTLSLRVDATYVSDFVYHPQLNLYDGTDGYHLVNARATLAEIPAGREGKVRISAWGKNLENKEYREFGIDFGTLGFAVNKYGDPRTWGIDVVYEFNR